tara:strand:- start:3862 stop:4200 length:339 start_codon:yes stop_codon:yes gene_type:complete
MTNDYQIRKEFNELKDSLHDLWSQMESEKIDLKTATETIGSLAKYYLTDDKSKGDGWSESLHKKFNEWGEKNNLKLDSADLMLMWNMDRDGTKLTKKQSIWLENFCQEWKGE